MDEPNGLEQLQSVVTADDVASLFNITYKSLAYLIYKKKGHRYKHFTIKKKNGSDRQISAPIRRLKVIQRKLAALLVDGYEPKPSAQGFLEDRSIVTNARRHLDKTFVLNIDIENFFGSIHFGRVRNLLMAPPFGLPMRPATVLAQICCYDGKLPQGAPTSPVITNLICRGMDRDLQRLAKQGRATYTRYVDDISISFTCRRSKLPSNLVAMSGDDVLLGPSLVGVIETNGFKLNSAKTRLHSRFQRLEVTGLAVNEFPNVRRNFVRRIGSMIYAWETYGLEAAAAHLAEKYPNTLGKRATDTVRAFQNVVKGRLAYLHMVRGRRDPIYTKLAKRFNAITCDGSKLPVHEQSSSETDLLKSVFVIEVLYDGANGELKASTGTGFFLKGVGFVTAAHVVCENDLVYKQITAFAFEDPTKKFKVEVLKYDLLRDLAICQVLTEGGPELVPQHSFAAAAQPVPHKGHVSLVGYPAYKVGQTPYVADTKVASIYGQKGVSKFEITAQIREGNSGGPVVSPKFEVVGIAVEGADKGGGNNGVVHISELLALVLQ